MIDVAIYDMDGLLTESESRWRQAEIEIAADLGFTLTIDDLKATMGLRMVEVAEIWYRQKPWDGPTVKEVAEKVVDRVIELGADATPMPGVMASLEKVSAAGLRVALCSSSDKRLIDATLEQLDLADRFEVVHSAELDEYGKPHPMPYLKTAQKLGVDPTTCLAFEDSLNGCLSARAAQMTVVAVPDLEIGEREQFAFCHLVLDSLEELLPASLASLTGR